MKKPMRVAVTGAAGQIGYSLLFRIASGAMLGENQPIILQLLDITPSLAALQGVVMELEDCAFPLLQQTIISDNPNIAFKDADIALLVGARPRSQGMERKELLEANGAIFSTQGKALNEVASRKVKVLVVGNPANTNAYIAMRNAPDLPPSHFTAMMRLDHNRALSQIANKLNKPVSALKRMIIWGNHSATQCPDLSYATLSGKRVEKLLTPDWIDNTFIPTVQQRGATIIKARGLSSAASAANAAIDHMRDWLMGTADGDWVSMGIPADGSYGIAEGVIFGYPVICRRGKYEIVQDLLLTQTNQRRISASYQELLEERDNIKHLLNH